MRRRKNLIATDGEKHTTWNGKLIGAGKKKERPVCFDWLVIGNTARQTFCVGLNSIQIDNLSEQLNTLWWWQGWTWARGPGVAGGTASLYPLPHYRPCFSALSAPSVFFLPPPISLKGHRAPPQKIKHPKYKVIYKSEPKSSTHLSIKWLHIFHNIAGIQT